MKKEIRIKFVDFWDTFRERDNFIMRALEKYYDVSIVSKDPELLFFSCFGEEHLSYTDYNCAKIFFTGENIAPDFNQCDYAMGFEYLDYGDRYLRFPLFAIHEDYELMFDRPAVVSSDLTGKQNFCNFIYSNGNADPNRVAFFHLLSEYKSIEAPGKHLRNTDRLDTHQQKKRSAARNKIDFLASYKFTIAFENSQSLGYTTEKIFDAFAGGTVPIYWGNLRVAEDFNKDAFINAADFDDLESLAQEVQRLDHDDEAFLKMLNQPVFSDAYLSNPKHTEQLESFFQAICEQNVGDRRRRACYGRIRNNEIINSRSRPRPKKKKLLGFF